LKPGTKQRIVGTVVLLALALIFLPIVFDGQGSYQTPVSSRIPPTPVISILPEQVPTRPVIIANSIANDTEEVRSALDPSSSSSSSPDEPEAAVVEESAVEATVEISDSQPAFTREIPSLSSAGLPQGWSVRLGSFSDADNADNLMSRLLTAGYKAYTRSIGSQQGALTGVYVGPWLERGLVNDYQKKLQEEFSLAGMVVPYELERF